MSPETCCPWHGQSTVEIGQQLASLEATVDTVPRTKILVIPNQMTISIHGCAAVANVD
jgi:hypothetical protein